MGEPAEQPKRTEEGESSGPSEGGRVRTRKTRYLRVGDLLNAEGADLEEERRLLRLGEAKLQKLRLKALKEYTIPLRLRIEKAYPGRTPRARLRCFEGVQCGKVYPVKESASIVLGRDERADLQILDSEVSRAHCRLENPDPWSYRITDLSSRNGTLLNGQAIEQAELHGGDVLTLGLSFFLFEHSAATLALELDDPALEAEERAQGMLRFETLIHATQERLAAMRHDLIQLDLARMEHGDSAQVKGAVAAFRKLASRLLREVRTKCARAETELVALLGDSRESPAVRHSQESLEKARDESPVEVTELARLELELSQVVSKLKHLRKGDRAKLLKRKQQLETRVEETRKLKSLSAAATPGADIAAELRRARDRVTLLERELSLRPKEIPAELQLVRRALDYERGTEVERLNRRVAELEAGLRESESTLSGRIGELERENFGLRTAQLETQGRLREAVHELMLQAESLARNGETGHARDLARRIMAIDPECEAARFLLAKLEPEQTSGALRAHIALDRDADDRPLSASDLPPTDAGPTTDEEDQGE